jgi:hypothetical protein
MKGRPAPPDFDRSRSYFIIYSTTLVTENSPFAWRGAFERAVAASKQSRGTSGRKTLKTGMAWAVGSTPEISTSLSLSTYWMTWSSWDWKVAISSSLRLMRASWAV